MQGKFTQYQEGELMNAVFFFKHALPFCTELGVLAVDWYTRSIYLQLP